MTLETKKMGCMLRLLRLLCLLAMAALGLAVVYLTALQVATGRLWRADPGELQRFYEALGDATDLTPRDAGRATYHLLWQNCAAFPAWMLPRQLGCRGVAGFMHPSHCQLTPGDAAEAEAQVTACGPAGRLLEEWLLLAPQLPRLHESAPGLEWNLDRFLLRAHRQKSDVRVVVAAVWATPIFFPTQHLTTLLVADGQMLSLGVDTGNHSLGRLLLGGVPYRLRSPDAVLVRSRYRHYRVLADYAMSPTETADVLRRVGEEWRPRT